MKKNLLLFLLLFLSEGKNICIAQETKTDSLLNLLKTLKEDTNKVNILYQLSEISVEDSAVIKYARQMLSLSEKLNYLKGIANSCNNIGYVYKNRDEFSIALQYLKRSLNVMEKIGARKEMSPLLNNIGTVYEHQGDISSALDYYQKSLKIREESGDKAGIAKMFNNIGLLYKNQNDFYNANEYLQKCLKLAQEIGDQRGIALALINIGFLYQSKREITKATEYFEKSMEVYKKVHDELGVAYCLLNLGYDHYIQENYDTSLNYYKKCLDIFKEAGDKLNVSSSLINIGLIYYKKKNYDLAQQFCYHALELGKQMGVPAKIKEASESLSLIYSAENKYKEAYQMHVLFKQMADSINNQETRKATVKKQMQYEFDKKEATTKAEQEKKDALAKAEIYRQKLIKNTTFGGVGVVGIFSFLLVRSVSRRRKTIFDNQVSQVEMKALRAQMNPHFIFNSLNSIHSFIQQNKGEKASDYLIKFSRLMRLILENSNHEEVPLESDLEALSLYIELEAARMNNKFTFSIDVDEELDKENTLVPPLILQPFVENAIWHGMLHKEADGLIKITISKDGDMVKCIVQDNGVGREKAKELKSATQKGKHNSLGMKITSERIEIINRVKKSKAFVALKDLYDDAQKPLGTLVEVQLPLETGF